jgi:multidrug efflux pump subunit AcrA (membrane-fusion protein)
VVDLSTVWVAADLYERDFATVTVGTVVTVTTAAYPGLALPGKVSYIDPQVNPDTRTTNCASRSSTGASSSVSGCTSKFR